MIRYAQSFVNGLYESKDVVGLYQVIGVVAQRRQLPEQFWLFRQLLAWASSTRSGVWQYYEAISKQDFDAVASSLQKFGLVDWAERYRSGMETSKPPECCKELDRWIDVHWIELENTVLHLIANDRRFLWE